MHQKSVKDYYRLITGVDQSLGQIIRQLKVSGQFDRTIVIFSSDNGFFLGEHGLAGKWYMQEESIRLPLIIRHPRLPKATPDAMVLTIDIAPTIMELAGAEIPDGVQGKSLVPLLKGENVPWRTEWFYEHHYGHKGRIPRSEGVRTDRWKYVRYIDPKPPLEQLFDLENDPHELRDLASDPAHAKRLKVMRASWEKLAAAAR
jgi:arylsulfatase A-like enzyme